MTTSGDPLEDTAEDLFEDAPCGYLTTDLDGRILKVNRTFERWTGLRREELLEGRRLQDLLSPGGRIYHETHYAPLLRMQGSVREIAVEIVRADGSRLPALVNSVLRHDEEGRPQAIRTTVFDATDRRRYEQELIRARRREQEIALELQRGLLAGELPEAERLHIGVSYNPAEQGLEVGGDWYDAFWLDREGCIGIAVGDVVGRGLTAAATMGQLRSAVRALATTGPTPGELLTALDRYVRRHDVGVMTTIAYAEICLAERTMRYACAGHPPPACFDPGDGTSFAWGGRSAPLAAAIEPAPRPDATRDLAPGAAVVLYTDGLIERSDRPLDTGMDSLLRTLDELRERPPAEVAETLTRELSDDAARPDDVCVLALRLD